MIVNKKSSDDALTIDEVFEYVDDLKEQSKDNKEIKEVFDVAEKVWEEGNEESESC